jgi:hypothetical protein
VQLYLEYVSNSKRYYANHFNEINKVTEICNSVYDLLPFNVSRVFSSN